MYFLWKRTQHGTIRISYDGLENFIRRFLTVKCRLHSFSLKSGDDAHLTLVMSSAAGTDECAVENRISSLVEPMGIVSSVVWFSGASRGAEWSERQFSFYKNPWAWMAAASSAALIVIAGWHGFFWTMFWGTAAWFAVSGISFLRNAIRNSEFGMRN